MNDNQSRQEAMMLPLPLPPSSPKPKTTTTTTTTTRIMYNAKYFIASPTYNKWVKLSAAGVHALDEIPDFKGM
jgi:hypothetical protein